MLRVALVAVVLAFVGCQVIGIDFGTEFWKAAIISPGKGFVVVENTKSERKTPNVISFVDGVRLFESEAANKKPRYPKQTFADINQLMPMLDNPDLKVPYDTPYELKNGTIVFELPDDEHATIQQILAMILKTIKQHASKQAGTGVRDCVLTVPSDWGIAARTALVNAAYIADMAVLSVLNDNTAAALNYAMTRNDNGSLNVMVFNLGSNKLQVSIIRFYGYNNTQNNKTIESFDVLSHQASEQFSGYAMDNRIAEVLAKKFLEKNKKNVKENKRAWAKLLQKCPDVKETLSANKETHVHIESLIDGDDLSLAIQRSEVEDLIDFSAVLKPINAALKEAGLNKEDINSVELIGGASRIPKVVSTVTQFFAPVEVGTHINGDQAIALGSVLHAANMSSAFRVKEIHAYDRWGFAVGLQVLNDKEESLFKDDEFFKADEFLWLKKDIELQGADSELTVNVYGEDKETIKKFRTSNLLSWKEKFDNGNLTKSPIVKLQLVLSSVGIVDTKDSFVNIWRNESSTKEEVEYIKEKLFYADEKGGDKPLGESSDQDKETKDGDESEELVAKAKETIKAAEEAAEDSDESGEDKEKKQDEQKKEEEPKKKKPKLPKFHTITLKKNVTTVSEKNIKHNLKIEVEQLKYKRYSKEEIESNKALLKKFEAKESGIKETAQAKNDLESRLYSIRRDFEEKYMTMFGTEEEVENLKKVVDQELAWLEENSYTGSKDDFTEHLRNLFEAYRPIFNRTAEYQERPTTVNKTIEYLGTIYEKTLELNTTHPWTLKRLEKLLKKINDTNEWYSSKIREQSERPLNEDPIVYNHEPIAKAEKLRDDYYAIRLVPRPKTKKSEEPKAEEAAKSENKEQSEKKDPESTKETTDEKSDTVQTEL